MNASTAARALRALQTKPPRAPVPHVCKKCGKTILGTNAYRKHLPLCKPAPAYRNGCPNNIIPKRPFLTPSHTEESHG